MKKSIFYIALCAALLSLSSCVSKELEVPAVKGNWMRFHASLESFNTSGEPSTPGTKTVLTSDYTVNWLPGDEISVFYGTGYAGGNKFTVESQKPVHTADFSGVMESMDDGTGKTFSAIHPYTTANSAAGGQLMLTIPSDQTPKSGTWDTYADFCVAQADEGSQTFRFRRVVGGFVLVFSEPDICRVTISTNNGEPLAGTVRIRISDGIPSITNITGASSEVTVTPPEETFRVGREYFVCTLPGEIADGITLHYTTINQYEFDRVAHTNITIERNNFKRLRNCGRTANAREAEDIEPIDLGLSVKWAPFNIGATKPGERGNLYAWAETGTKQLFSWATYEWWDQENSKLTKYSKKNPVIEPGDDAATVDYYWGEPWRTPTWEEFEELIDNCRWTWTTRNNTQGYLVESMVDGYTDQSIFLPVAGKWDVYTYSNTFCYWSATLSDNQNARCLEISPSNEPLKTAVAKRYAGASIRPVQPLPPIHVKGLTIDTSSATMEVGETLQLNAVIDPADATDKKVSWATSDKSVATVSEDGIVTALKIGEATITVTSNDGNYSAKCVITINPVVPMAVDLGLSVKWGNFNVGTNSTEEPGNWYAWGETLTKDNFTRENYKWWDKTAGKYKKYNADDHKIVLDPADDIAASDAAGWGGDWRIPTREEWQELIDNCTWTLVADEEDNHPYYLITSKKEGYTDKSIKLACLPSVHSSTYWSSSIVPSGTYSLAYSLVAVPRGDGFLLYCAESQRWERASIRPVYPVVPGQISSVSLDKTDITVIEGETYKLYETVLPVNAENKRVIWSSSNPQVATVSASGVVTGRHEGTATITVSTFLGGYSATCNVKVTPNIAEAVDMGLGVKWASWNMGANAPEEFGDYYTWGETEPYYLKGQSQSDPAEMKEGKEAGYDWNSYKWGTAESITKYTSFWEELEPVDDAAHVHWGDTWRLPSYEEYLLLYTSCTWTWTTKNGVPGFLAESKITHNSIFFPAGGHREWKNIRNVGVYGYFWTATPSGTPLAFSNFIRHNGPGLAEMVENPRIVGANIRPVQFVPGKVCWVRISSEEVTMELGKTVQLSARIYPSDALNKNISWKVESGSDVVTISPDGLIRTIKTGEATVCVVTQDGGYTSYCKVTVTPNTTEAVDLGLSVKWATLNIGAESTNDVGDFFAWGEIEPKEQFLWSNYTRHSNGSSTGLKKYNYDKAFGTTDKKTVLDPEDDAASVLWGGDWRMPTIEEWRELARDCTWLDLSSAGYNIFMVRSKINGNYIYIPSAGYIDNYSTVRAEVACYWTSSLFIGSDTMDATPLVAWSGFWDKSTVATPSARYHGMCIRPVKE